MNGYIYKILSKQTNRFYIGSSKVLKSRWSWHKNKLKNNKHHNIHLQRIYNKYGFQDLLFMEVECCLLEELLKKEQFYINCFRNNELLLNVALNAGGGDTISQHPNKENIIKKISLSSKKRYKNGEVSEEFLKSQGRFKKGVDHSGEKNSMYGKHHKDTTKEIIGLKTYIRTKFSRDIEKEIIKKLNCNEDIKKIALDYKCSVNKIKTLIKYNANKINFCK